MLLESLFPYLPSTLTETIVFVVACIGGIMLPYAVFIEKERRQDLIMAVGAACLLVYGLFIGNLVFSIAMAGLCIASMVEFIEIYRGLHIHSPDDLKKYKAMR